MYTKVVNVASTSGTQDITFTPDLGDPSWTPKVAILQWSYHNTTANSFAEGVGRGFGFTDGTNQRCIAMVSEDATTSSDTAASQFNNALIIGHNRTGTITTIDAQAAFSSWLTNGMRITWSNAPTAAFYIQIMFLGGDDITNTKVDTLMTTTGASCSVTGMAFQPDFGMFLFRNIATEGSGSSTTPQQCVGFAKASGSQWCQSWSHADAAGTSAARTIYSHDRVVLQHTTSLTGYSAFSSWNSDGFTLNNTDTYAVTLPIYYLVIKGGDYTVGNATEPAATGNQVIYTGKEAQVVGIFGLDIGTANTVTASGMWTSGFCGSQGAIQACVTQDELPASDPMANASVFSTNSLYKNITANATAANSTTDDDGAIAGCGSISFAINWSNIGNARPFRYVAFGGFADPTGTVKLIKKDTANSDTVNIFPIGEISSNRLETTTATDTNIQFSVDNSQDSQMIFVTEAGDLNNRLDWENGDWILNVRVTNLQTPNHPVFVIAELMRLSWIEELGWYPMATNSLDMFLTPIPSTGTYKFRLRSWNDGSQNATAERTNNDRLVLFLNFKGANASTSTINIGLNLSDGNDEIVTPLSPLSQQYIRSCSDTITISSTLIPKIKRPISDTVTAIFDSIVAVFTPGAVGELFIRAVSDTITISSTLLRKIKIKPITDTITNSSTLVSKRKRPIADSVTSSSVIVLKVKRPLIDIITNSDVIISLRDFFRSVVDAITTSSTLISKRKRPLTDSITNSSTLVLKVKRPLTDSIINSDILTKLSDYFRSLTDTIINSDSLTSIRHFFRSIADTITNSSSLILKTKRSLVDSITNSDSIVRLSDYFRSLTDTITNSDILVRKVKIPITDTIINSDLITSLRNFPRSIADSLSNSDLLVLKIKRPIIDTTIAISDSIVISLVKTVRLSISDTITNSDSITALRDYFRSISDSITNSDILVGVKVIGTYFRYVSDTITNSDLLILKVKRPMVDPAITILDSIAKRTKFALVDSVTNSDSINQIREYFRSMSDSILNSDTLTRLLSFNLIDSLSISDSITRFTDFFRSIADTITNTDILILKVKRPIVDTISILDSIVLKIKRPVADDTITNSDTLAGFKTWAFNIIDSLTNVDSIVLKIKRPIIDTVPVLDSIVLKVKRIISETAITITDVLYIPIHYAESIVDSISISDLINQIRIFLFGMKRGLINLNWRFGRR